MKYRRLSDDDLAVLSSPLVYSAEELIMEFREQCEHAANRPTPYQSNELHDVVSALCRMLDRPGG